ncbi:RES domain-containing protein [Spirosoma sp. BT702]|uniref:RES domain-containing protein n=1 Tax=Spirosoma profusum TaxID=2771354 RepID=A0A927AQD8_9BACT|nr:RES domain-containing protein [Spirosoma profusum]MBD2700166.1 RES domain-containing protein [Spirosoma profusum]
MLLVYRLQKPKYNPFTLKGEGASIAGGRWNDRGVPLVYASYSSSLAILETLVHSPQRSLLATTAFNFVELLVPEECIHEFVLPDLPVGWDTDPDPFAAREFLATYLEPGNSLAFSVPSVINPLERNLLINPRHPHIDLVKMGQFISYKFDSRL